MDKRSILFVLALSASLFFVNRWFDSKTPVPASGKTIETVLATPDPSPTSPLNFPPESPEELYVLENGFQQVVFSTVGGAISEINLPFQSKTNPESLVLPIGFDREMAQQYPSNDRFPSRGFWKIENGNAEKVSQGVVGGYYPLLRRSVFGENGEIIHPFSSRYFAFSVLSDDEILYNKPYKVTRFENNRIDFSYEDSRRKITKTYTLLPEKTPYCLEVEVRVEGDGRGLWLTTGIPEVELVSGNSSPILKYLVQKAQKSTVESLSLPKTSTAYPSISPFWLSNSNGFLGLITQPLSERFPGFRTEMIDGSLAPTKLSLIDEEYNVYPADKYPGYEFLIPLKTVSGSSFKARFFAGPIKTLCWQTWTTPSPKRDPIRNSARH